MFAVLTTYDYNRSVKLAIKHIFFSTELFRIYFIKKKKMDTVLIDFCQTVCVCLHRSLHKRRRHLSQGPRSFRCLALVSYSKMLLDNYNTLRVTHIFHIIVLIFFNIGFDCSYWLFFFT